jgi:phage terminase large subunit
MDFNVDNNSAAIAVRAGNILHCIDEIHLRGSNTDEMVNEIKTRYPNSQITVYPDPAGAQRKTSAGGRTDHTILRAAGFSVKAPHGHNAVRDGINAVNAKLRSSSGEISLFVDPRCKYTIESFEKFTYKEGSSQPDKDSGYDHMADALRYLVDYLFPIRQQPQPLPIKSWGHKTARFF